jgi:hypothetical protein
MKKRPPQMTFKNLSDILETVLKKRGMLFTSDKKRLQGVWLKAVGDNIAVQTAPEKLQKGTLFVKVSNSVWMQQLHFLKKDIIDNVNQQLGEHIVKDINFSIGEVSLGSFKHKNTMSFFPEHFPLNDKDKKAIEDCTASVSDQELKEILKRVMTKDIIRKKLSRTRRVP